MGFLRKVGRKVKKGIKKLFSSKIGAFLGTMAISMIVGPYVQRIFGGIKPPTEGITVPGIEQNLAEQAAEKELGKQITTEGLEKSFQAGANAVEKGIKLTDDLIAGNAQGTIQDFGASTLTESLQQVSNIVENKPITDLPITEVPDALAQESLRVKPGDVTADFTPQKPDLFKSPNIRDVEYGDLTFGQKIKRAGIDVKDRLIGEEGFFGDRFVPDVATSVGTTLITSELMGEEDTVTYGGSVAGQPQTEATQAAVLSDVSKVVPATQGLDFNQLTQSLYFGTLSPQWLAGQTNYSYR